MNNVESRLMPPRESYCCTYLMQGLAHELAHTRRWGYQSESLRRLKLDATARKPPEPSQL